jgi:hypothetical protein
VTNPISNDPAWVQAQAAFDAAGNMQTEPAVESGEPHGLAT